MLVTPPPVNVDVNVDVDENKGTGGEKKKDEVVASPPIPNSYVCMDDLPTGEDTPTYRHTYNLRTYNGCDVEYKPPRMVPYSVLVRADRHG